MSESVLPIFSSRSFIVSGLTFRSFEFILCMVLESDLVSFFYKWLTSYGRKQNRTKEPFDGSERGK